MAIVRTASAEDKDRLLELCLAFFPESLLTGGIVADLDHISRLIDRWLAIGTILVAEVNGAVVGTFGLAVSDHPLTGERTAFELVWYVSHEQRRGQVGSLLLVVAAHEPLQPA